MMFVHYAEQFVFRPDLPDGRQPDLRDAKAEQIIVRTAGEQGRGSSGVTVIRPSYDRHGHYLPCASQRVFADNIFAGPVVSFVMTADVDGDPGIAVFLQDRAKLFANAARPQIRTLCLLHTFKAD